MMPISPTIFLHIPDLETPPVLLAATAAIIVVVAVYYTFNINIAVFPASAPHGSPSIANLPVPNVHNAEPRVVRTESSSNPHVPPNEPDVGLPCDRCPWICYGTDSLHHHYITSHADVYCAPCRRLFTAPHNLKAHCRRSSVHTEVAIECLAGCGRTFCEASAMWKHIERAGCANAIATLTGFLERLVATDTQNLIVKPGVRPEDVRTARRMVGDDMYDSARGAWTCLMCNMANPHRGYLQAHLDSGVHDAKVFQCPDWRCGHDASTFSNLMLHIETRKCRGYKIATRYL